MGRSEIVMGGSDMGGKVSSPIIGPFLFRWQNEKWWVSRNIPKYLRKIFSEDYHLSTK